MLVVARPKKISKSGADGKYSGAVLVAPAVGIKLSKLLSPNRSSFTRSPTHRIVERRNDLFRKRFDGHTRQAQLGADMPGFDMAALDSLADTHKIPRDIFVLVLNLAVLPYVESTRGSCGDI